MTRFGELGDPSSAFRLFASINTASQQRDDTASTEPKSEEVSTRYWNVLLGALVKGGSRYPSGPLDIRNASVASVFQTNNTLLTASGSRMNESFVVAFNGLTCRDAAQVLLDRYIPIPNSLTYCLVAKSLANEDGIDTTIKAMELFRNATEAGIPADGRFVNAVIRCFGSDIDEVQH